MDEPGPFREAGFQDYILEPELEDGSTPDIIGSDGQRIVALELSVSDDNKDPNDAGRYRSPRLTGAHAFRLALGTDEPAIAAQPFFVTLDGYDLEFFDDDLNAYDVENWSFLQVGVFNQAGLKDKLAEWSGFSHEIPSYNLHAVPESSIDEIRIQLGALFYNYAASGWKVTPSMAAKELLGELADKVEGPGIRDLEAKVKTLLREAASKLDKYATWNRQKGRLDFKEIDSPQAFKAFKRRVDDWTRLHDTHMEDYPPDDEVEEVDYDLGNVDTDTLF